MYGSAVPPSSPFPLERTNYCSCVGRHRRNQTNHMSQRRTSRNQPHLPIPIHARYRRCDSQKLLHIEAPIDLTHLSLGTYVHTFLSFSTTVISSIPFNCYPYHSFAQTQTQTQKLQAKIPYLTLPTQNFKLSIHPVRELVAGCSDSRSKTHKRHSGGEIANNEGGLPYYQSWVISQRRRSWCCSVGGWASSYGGLCLLFMSRMYKSGKIR